MKMNFQDMGIPEKLKTFSDGKAVADYFERLLDDEESAQECIQPVSLLLLDINMPIENGIQALVRIKEAYQRLNKPLIDTNRPKEVIIPFVCYLS